MTQITLQEVAKISKKLVDKPNELRDILRHFFSFNYNIPVFSQYFFPEYIKGNVPGFHKDFYEILEQESNDAFAAPRGHAKSTTVGLIYNIWCIVNKKDYRLDRS